LRRKYSNISVDYAVTNMASAMFTETLKLHQHIWRIKTR